MSLCLHGSLALGALILLQHLQLAFEPEPFEWDVAMVQPADLHPPGTAVNESPPDQPVVPQAVAPEPHPPAAAPAQSLPPSIAPMQVPPAPAPQTPTSGEAAPPPPTHTATPAERSPTLEPVQEERLPQPAASVKSDETPPLHAVEPPAPPPSPIPPAPEPVAPKIETPSQAMPSSNAAPETSMTKDLPATPPASEVAALAPPNQSKASKPDDGWLSEQMGKWITDIDKHYPAALRMEGVQGKVVLIAILHEDGTLTDVKVAKSSGNVQLDQAAIADVERAAPITLSRPLGRPQRPIKFSISYDLKTAR